jgi:hypothetical protein
VNRRRFLKLLGLGLPALALAPAAALRRDPMDGRIDFFARFWRYRPGTRYFGPVRAGDRFAVDANGKVTIIRAGAEIKGELLDYTVIDETPPILSFPEPTEEDVAYAKELQKVHTAGNQLGKTEAARIEIERLCQRAVDPPVVWGVGPGYRPEVLAAQRRLNEHCWQMAVNASKGRRFRRVGRSFWRSLPCSKTRWFSLG